MTRLRYYKLIGHEVFPIEDEDGLTASIEWAINFENSNRVVRLTEVGPLHVSTVFLGLDHNYSGEGPPLIFETMVFGSDDHMIELGGRKRLIREEFGFQGRCSTWDEAEKMHAEAVAEAQRRLDAIDAEIRISTSSLQ